MCIWRNQHWHGARLYNAVRLHHTQLWAMLAATTDRAMLNDGILPAQRKPAGMSIRQQRHNVSPSKTHSLQVSAPDHDELPVMFCNAS